jgi:hypothetical protein
MGTFLLWFQGDTFQRGSTAEFSPVSQPRPLWAELMLQRWTRMQAGLMATCACCRNSPVTVSNLGSVFVGSRDHGPAIALKKRVMRPRAGDSCDMRRRTYEFARTIRSDFRRFIPWNSTTGDQMRRCDYRIRVESDIWGCLDKSRILHYLN